MTGATQAASIAETQTKRVDFGEQSLTSPCSNAQAILDINARAIDSRFEFVKKQYALKLPRCYPRRCKLIPVQYNPPMRSKL